MGCYHEGFFCSRRSLACVRGVSRWSGHERSALVTVAPSAEYVSQAASQTTGGRTVSVGGDDFSAFFCSNDQDHNRGLRI